MGRASTRENKNIYQISREEQGLTREKASEGMIGISAAKIEKIEYETQEPTPYDVVEMSKCYKRPDLCNYYCSHKCAIGKNNVPQIKLSDLSSIIIETTASINDIGPLTNRLIQIARDGRISDDEIHDFAIISSRLDNIAKAISALNMWVEKTAAENGINMELLNKEKELID